MHKILYEIFSDSKSHISRTLFSVSDYILVIFELKEKILSLISVSPCWFLAFGNRSKGTCKNGIIVILLFHIYFCPLVRSKYLPFFSFSLIFTMWSDDKFLYFLLITTRSDSLSSIGWTICWVKSQGIQSVSFSGIYSVLCIDHLSVSSTVHLLQYHQRINLPTQSCLILYSFCASFVHSWR